MHDRVFTQIGRTTPLPLLPVLLPLIALGACTAEGSDAEADPADAVGPESLWAGGPELWFASLAADETGAPLLGSGRNVTRRPGYDNQPKFFPDGTVLYTRQEDERTDIWRYHPADDRHTPVTETPDRSEYSPTPTPDGGVSAIVVEPDSMQRLWRYALDGTDPVVLFREIAPVGYHAWANETDAFLFVLGSPATLQRASFSGDDATPEGGGIPGEGEILDEGIGRSLNRVPGREAVSYPKSGGDGKVTIRIRDAATGSVTDEFLSGIAPQDHAWTPSGWVLYGQGHRLMAFDPSSEDAAPHLAGALPDSSLVISRLAVSDDGASIVLVVERPRE
ncbi:MAG: hypothetical protein RQ745_12325 [Longimicrobiales bacterium]|nr:hypothetical protein [Longimicrobiales bacterium]